MGTRGHGTYAKLYRDVWTHRKTIALAGALVDLGVPNAYAKREAVGQLHELLCWCIAESDDGQVGHLGAEDFARIVGWRGPPKTHERLWMAWRASGFLDVVVTAGHGPADVRVHDLREAAGDLFRKRDERRTLGVQSGDGDAGQSPPNGRPPGAQRPPTWRTAGALARAFGSGSGNGSGNGRESTPPPPAPNPVAVSAPADAVAESVPEPPEPHGGAERIADAWAEACPDLPQPDRPLAIGVRAKLAAAAKRERGRAWPETFRRVAASAFLTGKKTDFRASVIWAVGIENLAKIDAGQYDDGPGARPRETATRTRNREAMALLHPEAAT